MKVYPVKITLLSPFFNYCETSAGGSVTSPFIGDIALNYALNRVLKLKNFYTKIKTKPEYEELVILPYTFTIAKPIEIARTRVYIRNTLFNKDGGPDLKAIDASGRMLFKNLFKVQGIQAFSFFLTYFIQRDDFKLELPLTLRIGTGRECLALLESDEMNRDDKDVWLNLYSMKNIYHNFDRVLKIIEKKKLRFKINLKLNNYIICKNVHLEDLYEIFEGVF